MNNNRNDEILERSRNAKKDEGMEHATLKGSKLGEITMAIIAAPILIFAILRGEFAVFLAVGATVAAFVFAQALTEYRFSRRKSHLTWTIFLAIAVLVCLALFVAVSFGWWKPESYLFGWLPL